MKRADEAVEKVLAELRGVEAAPGFEERMVQRVREAAREQRTPGWLGVWQWVGVGCVGALLVGVGVNSQRQGKHGVFATNVVSGREARVEAGLGEVGAVEEGVSQRLKPRSGIRAYGTTEAVPLRKSWPPSRATSEAAGVLGVGFPAPPLPLTAQERLLLRAAQGGEPQPAAVFKVSVLPTHDAEEIADFVEFFGQDRQVEPSTTGDSE